MARHRLDVKDCSSESGMSWKCYMVRVDADKAQTRRMKVQN